MSATLALGPVESRSLLDKFKENLVSLGNEHIDAWSGLFLNFSRVNHDCVGNVFHIYVPDQQLKLLVANHDIPAG